MINLIPFLLVLVGTILGSTGTLLIKIAVSKVSFWRIFFTIYFWIGGMLFIISTVLYILALRQEELSVIYPLVSMSYLWTTLLSVHFLREKMNKYKLGALAGVILGIVLIGMGS